MTPAALCELNTVCEVCGDIGFKHLLVRCRDCMCSAAHQYCLDKIVFDASLADWLCYECLQRLGEVTCSRSLEKVLSERRASHACFCSTSHQPIIKSVESACDAEPWRNNMDSGANLTGVGNIPTVEKRSVDFVDTAHGATKSSENSTRFAESQKGSCCHREKTVKMTTTSTSFEESGEDIPSESESLESDDLQEPPGDNFVLSRTSYLSESQKKRVKVFIKETKPETTVFVAIMRRSNVQPPGPSLGISKEYASAYFPHKSTNVTLRTPGKSKKWHPIFYKRDESRKNMLMGQWLQFVRDNHVQEGDICLIEPTKDGRRLMFSVYLLHLAETQRGGACSQMVDPYSGESRATTALEVNIKEEQPTDGEPLPHESLESEDFVCPCQPQYIVPCRNGLSKSQKKIVDGRVRAIQSEVPICVAVMKNNNVGIAQKWMLELGSRYASVHLPARGETVVLQCGRKIWETKMVIHNGRRWFLNGGWPKFARDNDLRVGDICLFELKKNEARLTMAVHIISREQF